jgi:Holliday junction resolvase RusA-like endonuclease
MGARLVAEFFVDGVATPQGSKSATVRGGVAVMFDDNKALRAWRRTMNDAAKAAYGPSDPVEGPVLAVLVFQLVKPKSVRRLMPSVRPDADKLARACLDSLTAVVFKDDAQVVDLHVSKVYAERPGVQVRIGEFREEGKA